jgi:hypothetical protein
VVGVLCALALTLAGCGGPFDSLVSGTVTLDGKPLDRGTVAFFPASQGPAAYGRIRSNGSYSVRVGREKGLPSGEYLVTVVATEHVEVPADWRGPPPPGKRITPVKYGQKSTSGLRFTVEPGWNTIPIDLVTQ